MENIERLNSCNQYRAIHITVKTGQSRLVKFKKWKSYPMANVLQSGAGASAVTGSNIVLAETCSDVEGSNKMTLPWALPRN